MAFTLKISMDIGAMKKSLASKTARLIEPKEGPTSKKTEPARIYRRPQLVRSRVYDKQDDEQILP